MTSPERLAPDLVERVLDGLGLSRAPAIDLAGLRAIYRAWCRRVPFDNIRKRIHMGARAAGALPGDTAEDFFEGWLKFRTGGTCWAGNGALCTLLAMVGFDVRRGIGTMLARPDLLPNHGTVIVELEGRAYVVDASILYSEPLLLGEQEITAVEHPAWGVRCVRREGLWHIHWRPLHAPAGFECRIERLSATAAEFRERHDQTREWSPFNYELHARLIRGEALVGVAMGQRVAFDASGGVDQRRLSEDARKCVLIDELGISEEIVARLPPDTPTPPPPWSRSAALRQ